MFGVAATTIHVSSARIISSSEPCRQVADISLDVVETSCIAQHFITDGIGNEGWSAGARIPIVISEMMEARLGNAAPELAVSLECHGEIERAASRFARAGSDHAGIRIRCRSADVPFMRTPIRAVTSRL